MPEDVLDKLSKAIGRKVTPVQTAAPKTVAANPQAASRNPQYVVGEGVKGMVTPGNIDINNRPIVPNPEAGPGQSSTVLSMGIETDGKHVLIPMVSDGADGKPPHIMKKDEAIAYYKKTKKHLGIFDSDKAADEYGSSVLHPQQATLQNVDGRTATAPTLDSVLGRKVTPVKLDPLVQQRFKLYDQYRNNGMAPDIATKTALSSAATLSAAPEPSIWQKAKTAVANTHVGPGNPETFGQAADTLGDVLHRAWANPMGISDEDFAAHQARVDKFFDDQLKEILAKQGEPKSTTDRFDREASKFEIGLSRNLVHGVESMTSPGQLALLVGTFGESALARVAASTGIEGLSAAARTLSKLVQLHFRASMLEGMATGIEKGVKGAMHGDWQAAGEGAADALISGVMVHSEINHEQATTKVRGDLERVAREQYGLPEGAKGEGKERIKNLLTSRFHQLDPYQQGLVIDAAVRQSPEYQAITSGADQNNADAADRTTRQQARKLDDYYGTAMSQAWDENVAKRTIRGLQGGRQRLNRMNHEAAVKEWLDGIREHQEKQQKEATDQYLSERRAQRQPQQQESSAERSRVGKVAESIARTREEVWTQRTDAQDQAAVAEGPRREVESVIGDDGRPTYPAFYWGEENTFGVASDITGHSIYRQTPRGTEWLDAGGNFTENATNLFESKDPETADTVARLTALGAQADTRADADESTPEHAAEAEEIAGIRRQLVGGEITAKEAQRRAGIAEKATLPDEYTAARDGRLNGPFHESSAAEYLDGLRTEAEASGLPEEEVNAVLDESGMLARQQTESNLNHVYRPGDYVVSKRGVKWTLDSKGMLHPDAGGQPVPLMKRGLYSNDSLQLAQSGRVGYGTKTREDRRTDDRRRRETVLDIQNHQEEVAKAMRLAVQREGLQAAAEAEPRADTPEKQQRESRLMSRPPRRPESQVGQIVRMVFKAPSDPAGIIHSIAERRNVSDEEVMRLQLANDPERSTTTEAKVARLEIGDAVSDDFRKDRPWKVEQGKDGKLALRSGNASPLPLDRLNPSDRVRQLVEKGTITTERPEFTEADVTRAALDKPVYVDWQERQVDAVRERMEKKADPSPRNEKQARVQAQSAERRAAAVHSVAVRAVVDAQNPSTDSLPEAEAAVDKAEDVVKTAKEAVAQHIEAQTPLAPKNDFPRRAPISVGYKGSSGVIEQNNRQFKFHYELVPIDSIVMSHVWNGDQLDSNPEFFKPLQPREPKAEQVRQQRLDANELAVGDDGTTSGYNFNKYSNKTIDAMSGPPVLEEGGQTVSGNGRLRRLAKHIEVLNSIGDSELREAKLLGLRSVMHDLARESGIAEFPDDGKFYTVVRMLDDPIETEAKASEMGLFFNTSEADSISEGAKGIVYGRTLDDDILKKIGRLAEAAEGGLESAMREDPAYFTQLVVSKFGIPDSQRSEWFTNDRLGDPILTEAGARLFRRAVKGYVIKDIAVLDRIEGSVADRAYERALGYLVQLKSFPELDLSGKITEALHAVGQTIGTDEALSASRDKWAATYNPDQAQLLGMETEIPPEPDRVVETLWRAMHSSTAANPRVFSDRLKRLLGDETVQGGMFGEPETETPVEKFNRVFSKELGEVQLSRGDKNRGISDEEFDRALRNREMSDVEREEAEEKQNLDSEGGRGKSPEQPARSGKTVTLYRGETIPGAGREIADWIKQDPKFQAAQEAAGRWFTSDLSEAQEYAKEGTVGGVPTRLVKIEVPEEELDRYRAANNADAAKFVHHTKRDSLNDEFFVPREMAEQAVPHISTGKIEPPPPKPSKTIAAERNLAEKKTENGFATPAVLKEFLETNPATKDHVPELLRTARMMSEYVYDIDPPVGVDRKDALAWVLKERLAGIETGDLKSKRGQYSDPNIEKNFGDGIMKLHKAADASTFIHEFFHVIFPMLSDEDLKAIDTIGDERVWDGTRQGLGGGVYGKLSEKLAHGGELFLRDENPTGFTAEVKAVLAKIKDIMRKVYAKFTSDPLSPFQNTEESREVFSKMFGITAFDVQDDWRAELKKARAEEKKIRKPSEEPHPLVKAATEAGADGVRASFSGKVEDAAGDRVDPKKPTAVFVFANQAKAMPFWATVGTAESKVGSAELIQGDDGSYGVRFNTKTKPPADVLYQDSPAKHPGIELEETRKRLAATPESAPMIRKLLQVKVQNLENEIRAKYGAEVEPVEDETETAKQALQEVKSGKAADDVRKATDGATGVHEPGRANAIPKPPIFKPRNASAGQQRVGPTGGSVPRIPASLSDVSPVGLRPLTGDRGQAVGTVVGEAFDQKGWVESLKRAGLPESLPAPTWALDRKTADKLIFPGQKQVVQTALSALEQGDGAVVATATGTGKTYTAGAIAKEWMAKYPEAKILVITKNAGLLKSTQGVATNTFGFDVETTVPEKDATTGVYGSTYARIIRSDAAKNTKWDLVIADESGEARNWFKEENKQGKALIDITANAKKAVYFSATPFHAPTEYGYLTKLNLWEKGGFDKWIENNFAHEKVDGKVIARLDPAKQAKLRQQLIERGQLVSQAVSYDGFTAHFGVVPVTDEMKRGLDRIHEGFARAKKQLIDTKRKGLAEKVAAFEATYTKAFLERARIPQAIELAKKARANGWQVVLFSETSSEDLFRRETEDPGTYQQLDEAMGGQLSKIIPPFADVYQKFRAEFGEEIGDYSGRGNSMAEREKAKADFLSGETPMLYTTYAAGGIGVSLHDADYPERGIKGGDKPRVAIFLGPPYSGVLLEQAMGRTWRFGVKSDTHAVFLATDSEPDVRLMQQKVGPRMRALRASVLGERDSLASAMANYSDEERTRARQEAIAYDEGNEDALTATSFQVRSKSRNVGINDWSMVNFPPADSAKNKGMKYGEDVVGGDWSSLYQDQAKLWSEAPESPEAKAGKGTIDAIGNGIASGVGLPADVPLQNLDPADKDAVVGAASAVAADAVDVPVGRDKKATARQAMQSQMNLPGDKNKWILTFPNGRKVGVWKYTGDPGDLRPTEGPEREPPPKDIRAWYGGGLWTQEVGIRSIARQAGVGSVGDDIVRMNRSYQADADTHFADFAMGAHDAMVENKLDPHDPRVMNDVWDVVEGKRTTDNPAIQKAAEGLQGLMQHIKHELGKADVKLKTPDGELLSYKDIEYDRNHMPHRIDYDAKVEDPQTGEVHTLRDVMKETFSDAARRRIISAIGQERGYSYEQVVDYLKQYGSKTPVLGHIHRARTLDFPFIKKDWKTLMGYMRQAADAIAVEKNFGHERQKLDKEISRIPSVNGRRTIKTMFDGMLEPQEWDDWTAKAYNAAIAYEAASKMTISVVKLPTHLIHVPMGMKGRVMPLVKAVGNLIAHPKEVFENASYVGTIARQLNAADVIAAEDSQGITHQIFGKTGFNAAYKMVRAISGESARVWMEQYAIHELKRGNPDEARRLLRDVMLIGDKGIDDAIAAGRFTPEDIGRAQTAFANMVAWSNNPIQMPGWARLHIEKNESTTTVGLKRAVRLSYALQSFSLKSMSLLREHLWDEVMIHHNFKPLAYFLIAAPIAGQMLQATTAASKGFIHRGIEGVTGKQHKEDAWDKYITEMEGNLAHATAARALKFYLDSITFGYGMDMLRSAASPFLNLATGQMKKAGQEFQYLGEDMLGHLAGPAWSDLYKTVIDLPMKIGKIESGTTHKSQKPAKVERALEDYVAGQVPITKQIPGFPPAPKKTPPVRRY